jgi:hypothetical protein
MSRTRAYAGPLATVAFGLLLVVGGAQLLGGALNRWASAQITMLPTDGSTPSATTLQPGAEVAGSAIEGILAATVLVAGVLAGGLGLMWAWMMWRRRVQLSAAEGRPPVPPVPAPED